jgi:histone H3
VQANNSVSKQRQPSKSAKKSKASDVAAPGKQGKKTQKEPRVILKPVDLEMIRLQSGTFYLIPCLSFCRVIREILQRTNVNRISKESVDALRCATETYFVQLFQDSYRLTYHRARVTLNPNDVRLALFLRGPQDPGTR